MNSLTRVGIPLLCLAAVCGCSSSSGPASCDLSNVAPEHCADAHQMALPSALPPSRGNKFADDEGAAKLGFSLFFDSNLGAGVSCATCHAPELAFVDRVQVSIGKGTGTRNSPTTFNAARLSVFFWDGRADSLWSQPLFPIENPLEMSSTRLAFSHFIADHYKDAYEGVFGPLPDISTWPAAGKPGDAAFDALATDVQDQVNRFFSNTGKALDAYMRKNATSAAPLDAFLGGQSSQLIEPAQRGLNVFLENKCQSCHSGPMLSDESFHDVGLPSLPNAKADAGRADGLAILQQNPFNLAGPYADRAADDEAPELPVAGANDSGAFRTPSLRNVTLTFPYGHDGALASLGDVLAVHAPQLSDDDQNDLLTFFQSLSGAYPTPPWNDWPSPQ